MIADLGFPTTKDGWSTYLSNSSNVFGGVAMVGGALGQPEIAIPFGIAATQQMQAQRFSNRHPPFAAASDAAIDIVGSAIPASGGWGCRVPSNCLQEGYC